MPQLLAPQQRGRVLRTTDLKELAKRLKPSGKPLIKEIPGNVEYVTQLIREHGGGRLTDIELWASMEGRFLPDCFRDSVRDAIASGRVRVKGDNPKQYEYYAVEGR
jgi:hypothetical protein